MKNLLRFLFVAFVALSSCKKAIEDTKKNILLGMITNGQWYVESFKEADADITDNFTGFLFSFEENGTVTGSRQNESHSGTWEGVISTYSIISEFPAAGEPLIKLNGTWKVKDSAEDYVLAEKQADSATSVLKLRKKP